MNILFFDCDKKAENFLHTHFPKSSSYHTVDFELNAENIDKIVNPEVFEIISVFAHAKQIENHLLDKFSNLKMIATRSTGFNHIDLDYCKSRNILVCNVPNYGSISVAEFTIALMLGLLRKIYLAKSHMKSNNVNTNEYLGESINGKTIGIIGYGSIGQAVCHLLKAFGCHIVVFDPYTNQTLS